MSLDVKSNTGNRKKITFKASELLKIHNLPLQGLIKIKHQSAVNAIHV